MNMTAFDFSPLYRSTIGFDRLGDVMDNMLRGDAGTVSYPPYNIEKTGDDAYRISVAVAGFAPDEIDIETRDGKLVISGAKKKQEESKEDNFLYRGIAERSFERRFVLDAHVKAVGATVENGLLHVDLQREVPEALKPRRIEINGGGQDRIEA